MLTKIVWTCVAIAVVLAGGIFYYLGHAPAPTVTPQEIKDSTPSYSIGIKYPFFSGVRNQGGLNEAIWIHMQAEIGNFKATMAKRNLGGRAQAHKSALYIEYNVRVFNPEVATVRFSLSSYFTGDAHPSTVDHIFTYDLENNSVLSSQ